MTAPPPVPFALTDEEVGVAAARAAWRTSLAEGLLARHLAPLAAFMLTLLFAAVLGWTGLISRRAAEIVLLGAAAAYMVHRLWTRRRFFTARRAATAWAGSVRRAGPARLTLTDAGFRLEASSLNEVWRFDEGLEVEVVAGLVYVWRDRGPPLVWPQRAHADAREAEDFLAFARSRAGVVRAAPEPVLDDDD